MQQCVRRSHQLSGLKRENYLYYDSKGIHSWALTGAIRPKPIYKSFPYRYYRESKPGSPHLALTVQSEVVKWEQIILYKERPHIVSIL